MLALRSIATLLLSTTRATIHAMISCEITSKQLRANNRLTKTLASLSSKVTLSFSTPQTSGFALVVDVTSGLVGVPVQCVEWPVALGIHGYVIKPFVVVVTGPLIQWRH